MSNPNIDGEDSPAGPNRDGDGRDGTGQASVGHEGAGRENTAHGSTVHESTEHEGTARETTVPDGTGHHSDSRDSSGFRPGDLPEIEAPGLSAFAAQAAPSAPSAAANAAAGEDSSAMDAVSEPDQESDPMPAPFHPTGGAPERCDAAERIAGGAWHAWGAAAAVLPAPVSQQAESPPLPPPSPLPPAPSFGLRRLFAVTAVAAVMGGLAGSLTTAGFTAMTGSPSAGPSYDQVFADGLARINHEVAVLKGAIDTSTRTQTQQVAKIADRMDRAEKAQNDAGTRLAKAGDVLDRVERRLAASGEVTGGLGEARGSAPVSASAASAAAEAKRPVVEGWVLRDVYHGAAMIQGHGGVIAVLPGDSLPGLGRIEAVKRQDGRWVVVTARGLILPR